MKYGNKKAGVKACFFVYKVFIFGAFLKYFNRIKVMLILIKGTFMLNFGKLWAVFFVLLMLFGCKSQNDDVYFEFAGVNRVKLAYLDTFSFDRVTSDGITSPSSDVQKPVIKMGDNRLLVDTACPATLYI